MSEPTVIEYPINADEFASIAIQIESVTPANGRPGFIVDLSLTIEEVPLRLCGFFARQGDNGLLVSPPSYREGGRFVRAVELPSRVFVGVRRAIAAELEAMALV